MKRIELEYQEGKADGLAGRPTQWRYLLSKPYQAGYRVAIYPKRKFAIWDIFG